MRALYAIAGREIAERRFLFPAAALLGLLPFFASLDRQGEADRGIFSALTLFALLVATASLCGASVLGRDLGEGRLGFYFSRPVPWWSIWGGKLLGAVLLAIGATLLAALPVALFDGRESVLGSILAHPLNVLKVALLAVVLVCAGHAAGVAYRSRSAWLLLDLALACAAGLTAVALLFDLFSSQALRPGDGTLLLLGAPLAAALAAAGAVQLRGGRTDLRRGHALLSLTLWTLVAGELLALMSYRAWAYAATPGDLEKPFGAASPAGSWLALSGEVRHRGRFQPLFLLDSAGGRVLRLGPASRLTFPVFSADGRHAVWLEVDSRRGRPGAAYLRWVTLEHGEAGPVQGLRFWMADSYGRVLALTDDGSRAAVMEGERLGVWELATQRNLSSVAIPAGDHIEQAAFVGPDHLRVFRRHEPPGRPEETRLELVDHDVATGKTTLTGHIPGRGNVWVRLSSDALRLLALERPNQRVGLTLHDAASGALLATLVAPGDAGSADADFLADGRIALVEKRQEVQLRIFSADGREERRLPCPQALLARLAGEPGPGQLAVGLWNGEPASNQTLVVDVSSGRLLRHETGLLPLSLQGALYRDPRGRPAPGSPATALRQSESAVVSVDPASGARRVVH
jgi:hypothetical protein